MFQDDYESDQNGIFGQTEAIKEHFGVKSKPVSREGAHYQLCCPNCNHPQIITISWREMVAAAMAPRTGQIPVDDRGIAWQYTGAAMVPVIGCAQCKKQIRLGITPDEAARLVSAGQQAGMLAVQGR